MNHAEKLYNAVSYHYHEDYSESLSVEKGKDWVDCFLSNHISYSYAHSPNLCKQMGHLLCHITLFIISVIMIFNNI